MSLQTWFSWPNSRPGERGSARLPELDTAKGLAIFLVVLGHLVTDGAPAGNEWFVDYVVTPIYAFHMPFFMYLSGFIFFYTLRCIEDGQAFVTHARTKFTRLAPGFILFALIILAGKLLVSQYLHVDNQPQGFFQGLLSILLTPGESAAKGLWYIYVLFEYQLVVPLLLIFCRGNLVALVGVALLIHFMPGTSYFMLDGFVEYLIYFALGCWLAQRYDQVAPFLDRYRGALLIAFGLSFLLFYISTLPYPLIKLIIGCLSIPALHALVRMPLIGNIRALAFLGLMSYAIYLMNTIAIGFTKGVILYFSSWDGVNFFWVAPLLLLAGIAGPIVVKRYFFKFIPPLDRITS